MEGNDAIDIYVDRADGSATTSGSGVGSSNGARENEVYVVLTAKRQHVLT